MAATMCLSGAVIIKAGTNVSTDISNGTVDVDDFTEEAEAELCNITKFDLVTNWTALNAVYKLMFSEYCGRSAAIQAITYDMSGYTTRIEAEDMLNLHVFRIKAIKKLLDNISVQDFMEI